MLRFLADENFNNYIIAELRKRIPAIDIVRVQDVGMMAADDPDVLTWAAEEDRVVLTHDVSTMTRHATDRINRGEPFPGLFEVKQRAAIRSVVDDLEVLIQCGEEDDWRGQIKYVPLT